MAMKVNEPIADGIYAAFFVRVPLGLYFIVAGLIELENMDAFIQSVKAIGVVSGKSAIVFGVLLPYLELAAGILLVIGFWTTLAAIVSCFMLLAYIYVFRVFPYSSNLFNKDIILFGASLSLLFSGPGAFSIDGFRKSG